MGNNYFVYKHTSPSNKVYIGITSMNPKKRWANGRGYRTQMFHYAIEKYGWKNFEHDILFEGLTKNEAEQKERELIAYYKSNQKDYGYNIDNGGSSFGSHSESTKQKFSKNMIGDTRNRGRVHTEETRKHMSEAHIDNKLTEETKRKLSEFNTGKSYSDEVIEHMKMAARKSKSYPVKCVELNMDFDSVPDAVEYVNSIGGSIIRTGIQKVIKGELNTSGKLSDGTRLHWIRLDI
jgi:group I intron endonuclease